MFKSSIFQILNSFRIITFWLLIPFLFIGCRAAIRESKVEITLKDTVLRERVNHYASAQEFECVVDGRSVIVVDAYEHEIGDKVQLIYRDGDCIAKTWTMFYKEFLPQMGYEASEETDYELYFDGTRPEVFCELWIPIKKK